MQPQFLGDWIISKDSFEGVEAYLTEFCTPAFQAFSEPKKHERISQSIVELIQKAPNEGFLLIPMMDFIERVHAARVVEQYTFNHFELWLNQFSGISFEENSQIRGRIAGKGIPREEYQLLFPIGTGKLYPGSHYVVAHGSPDIDTTVASFWGWVDAFAARVSENLHFWNVPGGAPASQVEVALLFHQIFGPQVFHLLAKHRTSLTVSSFDLLSQKGGTEAAESSSVDPHADLEELRSRMEGFTQLKVTLSDAEGRVFPLGVVHASDLYKATLGTVTLRDFCNRDETKIPPYLEIISVIDHHKSQLKTTAPATVFMSDVQSSNTLVAQVSFQLNDAYSLGGMTVEEIEQQMALTQKNLESASSKRILKRLLQRMIVAKKKGEFFVSPKREAVEYLHFLYAILDDTDLLTKTTAKDLEVVASLLNRLKSLMSAQEVEVIDFDEIPRDRNFVKVASKKLLQNSELYSLYRKIYRAKEDAVTENLRLCMQGKPSTVFADTKEQNGCCRAGQAKIFASNFAFYDQHAEDLRLLWLKNAQNVVKEKPEIDLHLQMVSTVAGAEELYAGHEGHYKHQDELWIWISGTDASIEHLKSFLNAFRLAPHVVQNELEVEFCGENAKTFEHIFANSFLKTPFKVSSKGLPLAVLRFRAGTMNSRKAMISPYLPQLLGPQL